MPKVIAGHAIRSPTLRSYWSAPRTRPRFKGIESSRNVPTTVQSRPDRLSYLFLLTWFVLTGNRKPRSGPKINYQYISNVKNTINQRATMVYKFVDSCLLFIILWTSLNLSGALSRAKFALRNTIGKKIWFWEKRPYVRPRLPVSQDESLHLKRPCVLALKRIASLTLEIQTTTTKPILYFDLILMSTLMWITEKELERDKKQRRPISLKEKHKNFKKGGNASCHQGENEPQRKKS